MYPADSIPRLTPELASLRRELLAALSAVGPVAAEGLVSVTVETPWLHPRHLGLPAGGGHYWSRPADEHHLVGVGECVAAEAAGDDRFRRLARWFRALSARWRRHGPGEPVAMLGAAFDGDDPMEGAWSGYPNARLSVPRSVARLRGGGRGITFTARGGELASPERLVEGWLAGLELAGEEPGGACPMALSREDGDGERAAWDRRVAAALAEIAQGGLAKVVVTRSARVRGERPFEADRLLQILACMYPGCVLFAARPAGGRPLVAATPERLVALADGRVRSDALAGTTRRAADPNEDRRLAERLAADPKSHREHRLVREAVERALRRHCSSVSAPARPRLLRLRNLQHLHTPVEGRPRPGVSLLDLAADLHPTPAVGGVPAEAAGRWLRSAGDSRRGWYSGVVGWLSPSGEGELSVLLRCALLDGDRAHLFAGSGIVADSDPGAEWEESELKLAAMLRALENG